MMLRSWWYRRTASLERWGTDFSRALAQFSPNALTLTLAALVGIGAGFTSVGFTIMLNFSHDIFFEALAWAKETNVNLKFLLALAPGIGGLIAGPLIFHFAKEAKGHGVPEVMEAIASRGGLIRRRVVLIKAVASAVTIGSGGSAGQEGPIVQIGSALGSSFARMFHLSADRMKTLVGCGAAGGISAIFNAPIAGVLFALEIILGDFRIQTFSPVVVSSVLASIVAQTFLGTKPAFDVPPYHLVAPWELANYLVLGALCGVAAVGFVKMLYALEDYFDGLSLPDWVKPAIGGVLVGSLALVEPDVLGSGYKAIGAALYGNTALISLAVLILFKPLATSFTLGSGGSGGILSPSLFLGAMVGGLFGNGIGAFFPHLAEGFVGGGTIAGAYALVGMGAVLAATTHAWMASVVIVFEMTDNYSIILPLMFATVVGMLVSRWLSIESIYTLKLARAGRNVGRGLDLAMLSKLHVADTMFTNYVYLRPGAPLLEVIDTARKARSYDFPVVAEDRRLVGMISLPDVGLARETDVPELLVAADLASEHYVPLFPDETLDVAMNKFDLYDRPTLPVLSREDPSKIVGMLDRRQIMNLYERVSLLGGVNGPDSSHDIRQIGG